VANPGLEVRSRGNAIQLLNASNKLHHNAKVFFNHNNNKPLLCYVVFFMFLQFLCSGDALLVRSEHSPIGNRSFCLVFFDVWHWQWKEAYPVSIYILSSSFAASYKINLWVYYENSALKWLALRCIYSWIGWKMFNSTIQTFICGSILEPQGL
jgi:hypothetical protein